MGRGVREGASALRRKRRVPLFLLATMPGREERLGIVAPKNGGGLKPLKDRKRSLRVPRFFYCFRAKMFPSKLGPLRQESENVLPDRLANL